MKSLRILFIATGFYKVGDYYRYKALAERLVGFGHSVTIVLGDPQFRLTRRQETISGVDFVYPPYWGGLKTLEKISSYLPETKLPYDILYRMYYCLMKARDYDVVHGFHIGFNTYFPFALSRHISSRAALVFDWCDLWRGGIVRPPEAGLLRKLDYGCTMALERLSVRSADGVTVISEYLKNEAQQLGVPRDRVVVIPCGAETDIIKPIEKGHARSQIGIDQQCFLLGFSGFFNPDSELLIDALAMVRAATSSDVKLLFIGPANSSIRDLINQYGLQDSVTITGAVDHGRIGEYLSACDLLLLPFTDRPVNLARWPIKLGDYLASGRPVVAGGYGEVRKFFTQNPEAGVLCEGTAHSFAQAIMSLMGDPGRRQQCAQAARTAAVDSLDWADAARLMEAYYFDLVATKNHCRN
jgi:glycosyltransferase involved in cell wall biosynthesis